jgi:hypothetical protein
MFLFSWPAKQGLQTWPGKRKKPWIFTAGEKATLPQLPKRVQFFGHFMQFKVTTFVKSMILR